MNRITIAAMTSIGLVFAIGSYVVGARHGHEQAREEIGARIARLEADQHTLASGYLNRTDPEKLATKLGFSPAHRFSDSLPEEAARPAQTPEALASIHAKALEDMQKSFLSERHDAAWSAASLKLIDDALVTTGVEGRGVPAGARTDCRSRSCMITLDLADTMEVDRVMESFTTEIAAELPITRMVPTIRPDGRVELHVHASKAPPASARRGDAGLPSRG